MNWKTWGRKLLINILLAGVSVLAVTLTAALTDLLKNPNAPVYLTYMGPAIFTVLKAIENWAKHRKDASP